MKNFLLLSGSLFLLSACQTLGINTADNYLLLYQDYPPKPEKFQVCHDMGCENLTSVALDDRRWNELSVLFRSPARSAQQERMRAAQAIAQFEKLVGPFAGTMDDKPRNEGALHPNAQLDCIAETVNTTTYLLLFQQQGWLKWHDVAEPRHRGFLSLQGPHNTAVLAEKKTGKEFVIDSWFHANGELPEVVSLEDWMAGYDPDKK